MNNRFDDYKISRLQKNLAVIRKIAGWTAEDLGERIGVTRQTITNLEKSSSVTMTKIQYIAIRSVLDFEIQNTQNEMLYKAIDVLVDRDDLSEEEMSRINETIDSVSATSARKAGNAAILATMGILLGTLGYSIGSLAVIMTLQVPKWLKEIVDN